MEDRERIEEALRVAEDLARFASAGLQGDALALVILGAALRASQAENRALREKGQALRDAFPDSSWQDSRERSDAADEWDALAAAAGGEE